MVKRRQKRMMSRAEPWLVSSELSCAGDVSSGASLCRCCLETVTLFLPNALLQLSTICYEYYLLYRCRCCDVNEANKGQERGMKRGANGTCTLKKIFDTVTHVVDHPGKLPNIINFSTTLNHAKRCFIVLPSSIARQAKVCHCKGTAVPDRVTLGTVFVRDFHVWGWFCTGSVVWFDTFLRLGY